jgi:hypothetical protein
MPGDPKPLSERIRATIHLGICDSRASHDATLGRCSVLTDAILATLDAARQPAPEGPRSAEPTAALRCGTCDWALFPDGWCQKCGVVRVRRGVAGAGPAVPTPSAAPDPNPDGLPAWDERGPLWYIREDDGARLYGVLSPAALTPAEPRPAPAGLDDPDALPASDVSGLALVIEWRAFSDRFMDPTYRLDKTVNHVRDAFAAGWDAALARAALARSDAP